MKRFFQIVFIIVVLPLILYEGYYQYKEFKKKYVNVENKASTTNIRYVDRGYYWNYPFNEKFISYNEDGEEIVINTDALGFRNATVNSNPDILLLGDSFISAANTKQEVMYATLLSNTGMTVYNAGIDGTGTIHQAHILEDVLQKVTPKLVILNFYLGNDFRDNFYCADIQAVTPKVDESQSKTSQESKVKEPKIETPRGMGDSKNNKIATKDAHRLPVTVRLKSLLHNVMEHSGVLKLFYNTFYLPAKYQGTDMSYYDRGEMMIMAYNKDNPNPDTKKAIQKTEDALKYIKATLEAKKIPLLVVGIPSKAQVLKSVREIANFELDKNGPSFFSALKKEIDFDKPDRILAVLCSEYHIPYVSLLYPFRQQYNKKLYYYFDSHWNYIGQEAAAILVIPKAKELLKTPLVTPLFASDSGFSSEVKE